MFHVLAKTEYRLRLKEMTRVHRRRRGRDSFLRPQSYPRDV